MNTRPIRLPMVLISDPPIQNKLMPPLPESAQFPEVEIIEPAWYVRALQYLKGKLDGKG